MKIKDATISELQRFRISEKLTSQALVTCNLAQIKQTNPYFTPLFSI